MLDIRHITKSYKKKSALKDVSIHLKKGICFGLIGPNGAGKSTLMKIICGIIPSDEGNIQMQHSSNQIGYVPQEVCLEDSATTMQNLLFFGKINKLKGHILHSRAQEVLASIGLSGHSKDKVRTFSGGMKRRLNIGCALMGNPSLIIMDEPTVGIDPQSRQYILNLIQEMKSANQTIIYSTHYMEEAEKICDEVALLNHGKIIENTTMENLLKAYTVPAIYLQLNNQQQDNIDPTIFGDVTAFRDGYKITSNNPTKTMQQLLDVCEKQQLELEKFEMMKPKLEDVFFQLTGSTLRTPQVKEAI